MKLEQVCQTLNAYLSQKAVFRTLMPLASVMGIVFAALSLISNFIYLGGFVTALCFWGFVLGVLLTLSLCQFQMVAIALGIWAVDYAYGFLSSLIRYRSLSYGTLLYLVVYGLLAFLAYKKSLEK